MISCDERILVKNLGEPNLSDSGPSLALQKMDERRKHRHENEIHLYKELVVSFTLELEDKAAETISLSKNSIKSVDARVVNIHSNTEAEFRSFREEEMLNIWSSIAKLYEDRKGEINRLLSSLKSIENSRSHHLSSSLQSLIEKLSVIGFKLQSDLERIANEESLDIDRALMENKTCCIQLESRLLKEHEDKYFKSHRLWRWHFQQWREYEHCESVSAFMHDLNSEVFLTLPEWKECLIGIRKEQEKRHERRFDIIRRLFQHRKIADNQTMLKDTNDEKLLNSVNICRLKKEADQLYEEEANFSQVSYDLLNQVYQCAIISQLEGRRESLRRSLHEYQAMREEPVSSDVVHSIRQYVTDPAQEDFFIRCVSLKKELEFLADALTNKDRIYPKTVENSIVSSKNLACGFQVLDILKAIGKESLVERAIEGLDKIRESNQSEIAKRSVVFSARLLDLINVIKSIVTSDVAVSPLIKLIKTQISQDQVNSLSMWLTQLQQCRSDLERIIPEEAKTRFAIDRAMVTSSSRGMDMTRTASKMGKTPFTASSKSSLSVSLKSASMSIMASGSNVKKRLESASLAMDIAALRVIQRKIGVVLFAPYLPTNIQANVNSAIKCFAEQQLCNQLVDDLVQSIADSLIEKKKNDFKDLIDATALNFERQSTYLNEVISSLFAYFDALSKSFERRIKTEMNLDETFRDLLLDIRDDSEHAILDIDDCLTKLQKVIRQSASTGELEESFKGAMVQLDHLETLYHEFHEKTCTASDQYNNDSSKQCLDWLVEIMKCTSLDIKNSSCESNKVVKSCQSLLSSQSDFSIQDCFNATQNESQNLWSASDSMSEQYIVVKTSEQKAKGYTMRDVEVIIEITNRNDFPWLNKSYTECQPQLRPIREKYYENMSNYEKDSYKRLLFNQYILSEEEVKVEVTSDVMLAVEPTIATDELVTELPNAGAKPSPTDYLTHINPISANETIAKLSAEWCTQSAYVLGDTDAQFNRSLMNMLLGDSKADLKSWNASRMSPIDLDGSEMLCILDYSLDDLKTYFDRLTDDLIVESETYILDRTRWLLGQGDIRKQLLTDELEERLRGHWPKKGRIEANYFSPRLIELMSHAEQRQRQIDHMNDKIALFEQGFNEEYQAYQTIIPEFENSIARLRKELQEHDSICSLQGVHAKCRHLEHTLKNDLQVAIDNLISQGAKSKQRLLLSNSELLLSVTSFERGGNYSTKEIRDIQEDTGRIEEKISSLFSKTDKIIDDSKVNITVLPNCIQIFHTEHHARSIEVSMIHGLGKDFGGPRRCCLEKIRYLVDDIQKSSSTIDLSVDKIEYALSAFGRQMMQVESVPDSFLSPQVINTMYNIILIQLSRGFSMQMFVNETAFEKAIQSLKNGSTLDVGSIIFPTPPGCEHLSVFNIITQYDDKRRKRDEAQVMSKAPIKQAAKSVTLRSTLDIVNNLQSQLSIIVTHPLGFSPTHGGILPVDASSANTTTTRFPSCCLQESFNTALKECTADTVKMFEMQGRLSALDKSSPSMVEAEPGKVLPKSLVRWIIKQKVIMFGSDSVDANTDNDLDSNSSSAVTQNENYMLQFRRVFKDQVSRMESLSGLRDQSCVSRAITWQELCIRECFDKLHQKCDRLEQDMRFSANVMLEECLKVQGRCDKTLKPILASASEAETLNALCSEQQSTSFRIRGIWMALECDLSRSLAGVLLEMMSLTTGLVSSISSILDLMITANDCIELVDDEVVIPKPKSIKRLREALARKKEAISRGLPDPGQLVDGRPFSAMQWSAENEVSLAMDLFRLLQSNFNLNAREGRMVEEVDAAIRISPVSKTMLSSMLDECDLTSVDVIQQILNENMCLQSYSTPYHRILMKQRTSSVTDMCRFMAQRMELVSSECEGSCRFEREKYRLWETQVENVRSLTKHEV